MPKVVVPMEDKIEAIANLITDEPMNVDQIHAKLPLFSRSTIYRLCRDYPGFVNVNYPMTPKRYQYDPTVDISNWLYADRIKVITHHETILEQQLAEAAKQPKHSIPDDLIPTEPLDILSIARRNKVVASQVEERLHAIFELVTKCQKFNLGINTEPLPPVDEALMPIKELRHLAAGIYYRTTQILNELDTEDYYLRIPNEN